MDMVSPAGEPVGEGAQVKINKAPLTIEIMKWNMTNEPLREPRGID